MHDNKWIHIDLKPDNIVILKESGKLKPKLIDMGFAIYMGDEVSKRDECLGTPYYMSHKLLV